MRSLRLGTCVVDLDRGVVRRDGESEDLTDLETALLAFLADNAGRPVPRGKLEAEVWGYAEGVNTRAVDSAVKRLRRKIERDPRAPRHLLTVFGVGYRLVTAPERSAVARAPSTSTSFVGREAELAALASHLDQGDRLITVAGPGGAGKTRVLVEFAVRRQAANPVFCALASATTAIDLVLGVAACLGLRLQNRSSAAQSGSEVAEYLAEQGDTLLLLDNLEQVAVPAAELVASWLAACPELRIVATSRHRLALRAERVLQLQPLDSNKGTVLFVDRAHRSGGRIEPDDEADVHAIVEGVGGLPLAIELAAARTSLLSVAELRRRLAGALDVLRAPGADVAQRHEAIRGTLDWSWRLLGDDERCALGACGTFRGAFSVEAGEAVVGDVDALDHLERLRHRSWLTTAEEGRLALPPLLREYAQERLAEQPDHVDVWARHGEWFLRSAERRLEHTLLGAPRGRLGWRLVAEPLAATIPDVFATFDHVRRPRLRARAITVLSTLLAHAGPLERRPELARVGLALASEVSGRDRVRLLLAVGGVLHELRRPEDAASALAAAVDHARAVDEGALIGEACATQAWWVLRAGAVQVALIRFDEATALARSQGIDWLLAEATYGLAVTRLEAGREDGDSALLESITAARAAGHAAAEERALHALTVSAIDAERHDDARHLIHRARELHDAAYPDDDAVGGLDLMLALDTGDAERAADAAERELCWAEAHGTRTARATGQVGLGLAALARGDVAAAMRCFDHATRLYGSQGPAIHVASVRALGALAAMRAGDAVRAGSELAAVRRWSSESALPSYAAWFRACEAGVLRAAGEHRAADRLAEELEPWARKSYRVRVALRWAARD